MIRKDTRPLSVNEALWEYKVGRRHVAIYEPNGGRYFPTHEEVLGLTPDYETKTGPINPASILNYILTVIVKDIKPQKCRYCKQAKLDVIFRCNPMAAELNGDYTKHFICNDCYFSLAEEI